MEKGVTKCTQCDYSQAFKISVVPEKLFLCMEDEEGVLEKFESYSDGQKKAFVDWINTAKTEQTKVDRIAKTIVMVKNGEKFY